MCQSNGWHPGSTLRATLSIPWKEFCGELCPQDVASEPFFNNGVLFEKFNSFLPAEFLKKKVTGKLSKETTYIFYFKKLKRKKWIKSKKNRLNYVSVKTKAVTTIEIVILNVTIGGNIHTQIVAKNVENTFDSIGLSFRWMNTWIWLFSRWATILEGNISWHEE